MATSFKEIKSLDLPGLEKEILHIWESENTFQKSISTRSVEKIFSFYEGPPTANGRPGIHHILGRAIKDAFCRYKTLQGFRVDRKAGWDTHGLPVEIEVEKALGIKNREEIESFGIAKFNAECKRSVLKYKKDWDALTKAAGYWVDLSTPYVTFDNEYIESVWWLIKQIHEQGLLYKGHKIQWYSPGSGTVLSSHEVSLGYKEVTDPSVYVKFPVIGEENTHLVVWTTTPWTLPSNVALVVNPQLDYVKVETGQGKMILAEQRLEILDDPGKVIAKFKGQELLNIRYQPLFKLNNQKYGGKSWSVLPADYVTVEDGSGIVHIAPAFGAEDYAVAIQNDLPVVNPVSSSGYFDASLETIAGKWFKDADKIIIDELKKNKLLLKRVNYKHNYPFDWRKGTPLMSYPVESWFIRTTEIKNKLVDLNNAINWYPPSVQQGRFGNWLENNVDWALSRKRFWGTPLPIWMPENGSSDEIEVIGSIKELRSKLGNSFPEKLDLHRPQVDNFKWHSESGAVMKRVPDVLDVWFDSGAMPFAQWHYPFENRERFDRSFPADFICEGIDQTRGWFYTLHAIAALVKGEKAFKNVVVNGLILDEKGEKMSKSKRNTIDPFKVLESHGADVVRWYVISNSAPWDDMKFSEKGLSEVRTKLFGTLENVYRFFSSYANIDGFTGNEAPMVSDNLEELDRWLLSRLNSTAKLVSQCFDNYDCTGSARAIEKFVDEFSNWYIRRSRERFWAGKKTNATGALQSDQKLAAYLTTIKCLRTVAIIMSPIAPFFSDWLFRRVDKSTDGFASVHLAEFPEIDHGLIDVDLERRMELARRIVQMILLMRNKAKVNVRQPLKRILLVTNKTVMKTDVEKIEGIVLDEVNVKSIDYVEDSSSLVHRTAKADFKKLGPRLGGAMKNTAAVISSFTESQIDQITSEGVLEVLVDSKPISINLEDIQIYSESTEALEMAQDGMVTVALDMALDDNLRAEGFAREIINRVQSMRKNADFNLTDRIVVTYKASDALKAALNVHSKAVGIETLASKFTESPSPDGVLVKNFQVGSETIEIGIALEDT